MNKEHYKCLLAFPEWKEKRKEIMKRDKCCTICGSISKLEVHHLAYIYDREPWDYPDEYFTTLCRNCHQQITEDTEELKELLNDMKLIPFWPRDIINRLNT